MLPDPVVVISMGKPGDCPGPPHLFSRAIGAPPNNFTHCRNMLPPMLSAKLTGIIIIWDLYTSRHYLQHIVLNIGILRYHNIVHTGICTTKKFCINDQWRGNEILWLSNTLENDKQPNKHIKIQQKNYLLLCRFTQT